MYDNYIIKLLNLEKPEMSMILILMCNEWVIIYFHEKNTNPFLLGESVTKNVPFLTVLQQLHGDLRGEGK